jgi:hypothetical protein
MRDRPFPRPTHLIPRQAATGSTIQRFPGRNLIYDSLVLIEALCIDPDRARLSAKNLEASLGWDSPPVTNVNRKAPAVVFWRSIARLISSRADYDGPGLWVQRAPYPLWSE